MMGQNFNGSFDGSMMCQWISFCWRYVEFYVKVCEYVYFNGLLVWFSFVRRHVGISFVHWCGEMKIVWILHWFCDRTTETFTNLLSSGDFTILVIMDKYERIRETGARSFILTLYPNMVVHVMNIMCWLCVTVITCLRHIAICCTSAVWEDEVCCLLHTMFLVFVALVWYGEIG